MRLTAFGNSLQLRKGVVRSLLVIKLTAVFLIALCLNTNANSYAQKINLSKNDVAIDKVFKEIKRQTGYTFIYKQALLKAKKVTVIINNASLEQVLDICLKDLPLSYTIVNKMVIIKEKEILILKQSTPVIMPPVIIKGKVLNDKGEPLSGASVSEKNMSNSTATSEDGSFAISVAGNQSVLIISFVGYTTREVVAGNQSNLTISLAPLNSSMDAVVVVGYGRIKKRDLTGAVSSVSSEDLNAYPVSSPLMGLQGKTSGVQVLQNSGAPGAPISVRIRGANSLWATTSLCMLLMALH